MGHCVGAWLEAQGGLVVLDMGKGSVQPLPSLCSAPL